MVFVIAPSGWKPVYSQFVPLHRISRSFRHRVAKKKRIYAISASFDCRVTRRITEYGRSVTVSHNQFCRFLRIKDSCYVPVATVESISLTGNCGYLFRIRSYLDNGQYTVPVRFARKYRSSHKVGYWGSGVSVIGICLVGLRNIGRYVAELRNFSIEPFFRICCLPTFAGVVYREWGGTMQQPFPLYRLVCSSSS